MLQTYRQMTSAFYIDKRWFQAGSVAGCSLEAAPVRVGEPLVVAGIMRTYRVLAIKAIY